MNVTNTTRMETSPPAVRRFQHKFLILGLIASVAFWLAISLLRAYLLDPGPFANTLFCSDRREELLVRGLTVLMLVSFGAIVDHMVRREHSLRSSLERLIRVVEHHERSQGQPGSDRGDLSTLASSATITGVIRAVDVATARASRRTGGLLELLDRTADFALSATLERSMNQLYDALKEVIPYDRLGLALVNKDQSTVTSVWARSDLPVVEIGVGYSAPLQGSSLEAVLRGREPRILNDLQSYLAQRPDSKSTRRILAEGIRSSLTCPLYSEGNAIGFIFFSSARPGTYTRSHVTRFQLVARHVAAVVARGLQHQMLLDEKKRSEALLLNVIPERIAVRLRDGELPIVEYMDEVSVMFIDIVGFTRLVEHYPAEALARFLQAFFAALDEVMASHRVEKIKTIGDAYMVISRDGDDGGALALCRAATEARQRCATLRAPDGRSVAIRGGIACGSAIGGVLEQSKFAFDVWGGVVNRASRLCEAAAVDEILVAESAVVRLQAHCRFEPVGVKNLRGVGGVRAYRLLGTVNVSDEAPSLCVDVDP